MSSELKSSSNSNNIVLVLGGCGFIGRHLVTYLSKNHLADKIIVADKSMPATSSLNAEHKAIFENKEMVEFKQSDLSKDPHVTKLFNLYEYKYIFNCCGETRCGLSEEEYKQKNTIPAEKCGAEAWKKCANTLKKWIEISSAAVYNADDKPSNEESKLKPWTIQAKYRLEAENKLKSISPSFPLVILRPSIVYGISDLTGLTPRISVAAVYKQKKEKMKLLWDKSLKINTIHVADLVRAMWLAAEKANSGDVFNLSDSANLDQGTLNQYLGNIFKIETGFLGSIISHAAKLALQTAADNANDEHVPVWTTLCNTHKVLNTPISPYIDKELLSNNHLCIDGTKIAKQLNFKYEKVISEQLLREQIDAFIAQGLFPPIV